MNELRKIYSTNLSNRHLMVFLILTILSISSCTVQLAPSFNKEIVSGIIEANKDAMEFFASVEKGTTLASFNTREDKYNKLIGAFEALSVQIKARPVPDNKIKEKVNKILEKRKVTALVSSDYPSADAIDNILTNLKKMKSADDSKNLGPGAITPFKEAIVVSTDQALTYENFLER